MPDEFQNIAISDVDPSEAFVVDTTQDPVEETPKVDPIAELSKANGGIDLSGFTDEGAAKTHLSKLTHLFAEAGQRALAPVQQPQPVGQFDYLPQNTAVEDDPLELEEVEEPPVPVTKKPRATKRERELERRLAAIETQHRLNLEQQIASRQAALASEAREAVDALKSEVYGVGGTRSFDQQVATRVLLERAIAIANGAPQFGYRIGLGDAIRMVAAQSGGTKPAPAPVKEKVGLEPRSANAQLPVNVNSQHVAPGMGALPHGPLTSYTRDPAFLAAVKSLAKR